MTPEVSLAAVTDLVAQLAIIKAVCFLGPSDLLVGMTSLQCPRASEGQGTFFLGAVIWSWESLCLEAGPAGL